MAVYVTGEDAGINKVLGSKLVSAIARSNEFSAIERTESFLAELNKEQNYQRTGAVDDSELSRLGKQFGVQYICVAAVSDAFNEKYLSARLIDVESAQVERTASSSGTIQSLESLVSAANAVSNDLLSNLGNSKQSNSKKVAVYVVKNEAGRNIGRVLGDKLVAGFTNSGRYIAIERTNSFLTQLNKEQNYQHSGAVDDSDLSRIGKQFGVQYVCVADVSDVFGEKYISARLIDVETAEVVNTHDVGGEMNNMNGCLRMANEIATNLSKGTFAEQAEEARLKEEAERARLEAEERILQRKVENKKTELIDAIKNGYITIEKDGHKYMICLTLLTNIKGVDVIEAVKSKKKYVACGYGDWEIGFFISYTEQISEIASEYLHYLNVTLPICKSGQDLWVTCCDTDIFYIARKTRMDIKLKDYQYIDGTGNLYDFRWSNYGESKFSVKSEYANAILIRKVR